MRFIARMYFVLYMLTGLAYLSTGLPRVYEVIDLLSFVIALCGLFGYAWAKQLIRPLFWKIYLVLAIAWNIVYMLMIPAPATMEEMMVGAPDWVWGLLSLILYIPLFVYLWLYPRDKKMWK